MTFAEPIEAPLNAVLGPDGVSWFNAIASGDIVKAKKPIPNVYHLALAILGVPAAREKTPRGGGGATPGRRLQGVQYLRGQSTKFD
jgi:hypothetical protein